MNFDDLVPVQLVVTVWVYPDANLQEVLSEMDYNFVHPKIFDSEIREVNTEI